TALTNSEQGESLQPVQKEAIQAATIKAVVAGVKLIANATSVEVQNTVLDSLGQILSSTTTLGLEITQEQTDAVLEAVESVASESDDVNDALDKVVSMIPRPDVDADDVNSELASQNSSAPAQLVNHIVQQMQQFAALN